MLAVSNAAAFSALPAKSSHVDFVIYKDGKAFLIVNASRRSAEDILASFRRNSSSVFTMKPCRR